MAARLDVFAQPLALFDVGDVLEFVRDRRRVRALQARQHVGERVAGNHRPQDGGGHRGHQRRR